MKKIRKYGLILAGLVAVGVVVVIVAQAQQPAIFWQARSWRA